MGLTPIGNHLYSSYGNIHGEMQIFNWIHYTHELTNQKNAINLI